MDSFTQDTITDYLNQAKEAQQSGQLDNALTFFNQVLDLNPESREAHQGLGEVEFARKQFQQAEKHYRKAIELGSKAPFIRFKLGRIAQQDGHKQEALKYYKEAIALNGKNPNFHVACGNIYLQQKELDLAEESYKSALALKNLPVASFKLGQVAQQRGLLDTAISYYQTAISRNPKNPQFYRHLASAFEQQGNTEAAKTICEQALEINPNFQPALEALERLNQPEVAEPEIEATDDNVELGHTGFDDTVGLPTPVSSADELTNADTTQAQPEETAEASDFVVAAEDSTNVISIVPQDTPELSTESSASKPEVRRSSYKTSASTNRSQSNNTVVKDSNRSSVHDTIRAPKPYQPIVNKVQPVRSTRSSQNNFIVKFFRRLFRSFVRMLGI